MAQCPLKRLGLVAIVLIYLPPSPGSERDLEDPYQNCNWMLTTTFKEVCKGTYPKQIAIKYRDELIEVGEPYVVYRDESNASRYMISFKRSELHACSTLKYVDRVHFKCETKGKPVNLLTADITCFQFHVEVVDELLELCMDNLKKTGISKHSGSKVVGMHYTLKTTVNIASRLRNQFLVTVSVFFPVIMFPS